MLKCNEPQNSAQIDCPDRYQVHDDGLRVIALTSVSVLANHGETG
ncbi:hypothetical protein [Candidatus Spongiihabitans sp.]